MFALIFSLAGCAAAQMHTDEQLATVATGCGLSGGDVMQDATETRLLFIMNTGVTGPQRACVYGWAHRNHMHLVVIHLAPEAAN
ncbi:hypothetical protein [Sphingomonas sp.]|uniref:hypothetical protein n=1 Tax=Sphingomonas sp. TaxID=28214 RepID=UPI0025CD9692|nr:hypothetical protein [Sphingomonas sp.]MBV9527177.1 hypothetical protein [Sphingomonas sp.]